MARRMMEAIIVTGVGLMLALLAAGDGAAVAALEHDAGRTGPAQAPVSRPRLEVSVEERPGFSRFVFGWRAVVDYRVAREGASAIIRFDRAASLELEDLRANLPKHVTEISAGLRGGNLVVGLVIDEAARLRYFRTGARVVVDVLQPVSTRGVAVRPLADPRGDAAEAEKTPGALSPIVPSLAEGTDDEDGAGGIDGE